MRRRSASSSAARLPIGTDDGGLCSDACDMPRVDSSRGGTSIGAAADGIGTGALAAAADGTPEPVPALELVPALALELKAVVAGAAREADDPVDTSVDAPPPPPPPPMLVPTGDMVDAVTGRSPAGSESLRLNVVGEGRDVATGEVGDAAW